MFRAPWWLAAGAAALAAAWGLSRWAASRRARVAAALGGGGSLARAAAAAAPARGRAAALRLAALALIFAALAGPQWGIELVETRGGARQVVVAVDTSLSMRTEDVKPNRLERAKTSLSLLLDQLEGDRVGVVAFAGDAQVACPLTSDIEAAKELLGALDVGSVPTPGTAIGTALRTATAMVARYSGDKTVVLLTDGEDHKSDPLGAAREAASAGVRVFTIGIGTPEGEPIPTDGGGYKKDARGATVVSRLGEDTLSQIARETGGEYYRTSPGEDEIGAIVARVKAGRAAEGLSGTTARWRDRYAWPLAAAFLLLLLEMLLPLLPSRAAKAAAVLLVLAAAAPASAGEGTLRAGNKRFSEGKYEDALELYGEASGQKPSDPRPVFNAGDALYRLERDSDAAGAFDSVAARRDAPGALRAAALYNLGNARFHAGDYGAAVDAYRRALALSPSDADARRNLVIALKRKKSPPPPKKDKKNDQNQNQQKPQPQPQPDRDKSGAGGRQDRPRPQDAMTREDAERVLRAVQDREKAARKQAAPSSAYGKKPPTRPPTGEDW